MKTEKEITDGYQSAIDDIDVLTRSLVEKISREDYLQAITIMQEMIFTANCIIISKEILK